MARTAVDITQAKMRGLAVLVIVGEVVISIICSGQRLVLNVVDRKIKVFKEGIRVHHTHLRLLPSPLLKMAAKVLRKKKTHLDHQKNCKWRIKGTADLRHLKSLRVMINQEQLLPNSALLSNPKLLLRLQLNHLQIFHPNRKDLSNLMTTVHRRNIPKISTLIDVTIDLALDHPMTENSLLTTTTDDIPMNGNSIIRMIADQTVHALHPPKSSRRRSNPGLRYLPNSPNRNPYIIENLGTNPLSVLAHMEKFSRPSTFIPRIKWL